MTVQLDNLDHLKAGGSTEGWRRRLAIYRPGVGDTLPHWQVSVKSGEVVRPSLDSVRLDMLEQLARGKCPELTHKPFVETLQNLRKVLISLTHQTSFLAIDCNDSDLLSRRDFAPLTHCIY